MECSPPGSSVHGILQVRILEWLETKVNYFTESGNFCSKPRTATVVLVCRVTKIKVRKLATTAVGGAFFLLQLANHTGYIKVDWQRVEKDMKKAKEELKIRKSNQIPTEVKNKAEEVVSFVKKNVLVTGGFFGGFLLGMAS
ncbi:hypothetical protein FD754_023221 [Muntiacus muntjak]|uniref:FUN14 domain-containing protein 2 n=1 Tax=Muntiacus muntjak TaxID=9888 RepID=A0A5N3UUQ4_MUNMU|nr:hypothetical protein FD754_023328 [Muntiacus muntjak]KAB0340204.1 hypothetical protein FD754_023325 [Muntiacus muntjak]KAB0340334.1 hypothetical protein FD754_023223 [Muntiacus muntjak]KAB0340337.1 hypothetical protein FD754_023221 [Muntiacus muntjak]